MVKHIVLWNINDKYSADEKEKIKRNIKLGLEDLKKRIPGLLEIKVNTKQLESSNADLMLDATFESEEALKAYSENPVHIKAANSLVRGFMVKRSCFDYEI